MKINAEEGTVVATKELLIAHSIGSGPVKGDIKGRGRTRSAILKQCEKSTESIDLRFGVKDVQSEVESALEDEGREREKPGFADPWHQSTRRTRDVEDAKKKCRKARDMSLVFG